MSRTPSDAITWGMMLRKLPAIAKAVPRIVKGMKLANVQDPTQPCGLGWCFEQATQRNPQGPALLCGETVLSYAQVNAQANRIAHYLLAQGIGKGDCVAIFIENRPQLLISVLAMAKVGAVSAMLNTSQTGDALVHSLALVSPVAVVVGMNGSRPSTTYENEPHCRAAGPGGWRIRTVPISRPMPHPVSST